MSQRSTQFEATEGGMVLANAILLYRTEADGQGRALQGASAFASLHPVEHQDGRPTIGAGAALSRAALLQWTEALGRAVVPEILPANVLVAHADMLAWWSPEQVRPAYFALTSPPAGLRALGERIVTPVPYPAHLFVATRHGLGVYALPTSERPTAETELLYSPILNVFIGGQLCWGNIPEPKTITASAIPEFERAVFESWSTHPNAGQEHTVSGKGGLVRLWDELAARRTKRFPVKRLRPFGTRDRQNAGADPITLGRLIAARGSS